MTAATSVRPVGAMDLYALSLLDPNWTEDELRLFLDDGGFGLVAYDSVTWVCRGFLLYKHARAALEVRALAADDLTVGGELLDQLTGKLTRYRPRALWTLSEYEDDLRSLLIAHDWEVVNYSHRGTMLTFAGYAPVPLEAAT